MSFPAAVKRLVPTSELTPEQITARRPIVEAIWEKVIAGVLGDKFMTHDSFPVCARWKESLDNFIEDIGYGIFVFQFPNTASMPGIEKIKVFAEADSLYAADLIFTQKVKEFNKGNCCWYLTQELEEKYSFHATTFLGIRNILSGR